MNYNKGCVRLLKQSLLVLFALLYSGVMAQEKHTVSGYMTDASTGEQLIGVNIYDTNSGLGTSANEYGFYSLTLPQSNCKLRFTFVGYGTQDLAFYIRNDTTLNIRLVTDAIEFQELEVTATQSKVDQSQMSVIDVPLQKLAKIPAIMGETDVLKVIQLLPGVQSGTEGTSGIYVRGGGADQNLFLLDGVPVYNASHLFGFFSVFNPGAVKAVKLYKGGFPARYGGRLSSVVDIRMKEGNDQKFKGEVSVGLIASRINLEGPLVKGKSSYLISARRTYIDVLTQPFISLYNTMNGSDDVQAGYYFQDFNAKVNHKFSDRSRLYLSTYSGKDKIYSSSEFAYSSSYADPNDGRVIEHKYGDKSEMGMKWGNRIAALRWNYLLTNKLFSNTTLTYSKYHFNTNMFWGQYDYTEDTKTTDEFDYFSSIRDLTAKVDFDYFPHPNHAIKFGAGYVSHFFEPGVQVAKVSSSQDPDADFSNSTPDNDVKANEHYVYVEDNMSLGERLKVNLGLHYSGIEVQNKYYSSWQPRLSARFKLMEIWSVKASYAKMTQYVHLLSSSSIDLPTDLWVPVTKRLTPPVSYQYALGTSIRLPWNIDFTLEGFYKEMDHLIAYKDGASFSGTASTNWDDKVETGSGAAYGLEFLLEKSIGNTTGWIGYTLAKSDRHFDHLNQGMTFPAHYDRRHDLSLVLTHTFSPRFDIGMTWVYNTGNAVTLGAYDYPMLPTTSGQSFSDMLPKDYGGRNSYRMPSYHRMDIGMNFHKKKKYGIRTWNVSLYNAYSRQNAFMLMWKDDYSNPLQMPVYDDDGHFLFNETKHKKVLKQFSLFPIIPSVSYTFKF